MQAINKSDRYVIFLLHTPPPIHGSSVIGKAIVDSQLVNDSFSCKFINLLASKKVGDSGKINISKIIFFFALYFKLFYSFLRKRTNLCYFALTSTGFAFIRDAFFVALLKLFKVRIVFHLHNKGVNKCKNRFLKDVLYPFVFRDSKVILLSKYLYEDIANYVSIEDTYICPNGIPDIKVDVQKGEIGSVTEILFLSNLIYEKGVFVLLKACVALKKLRMKFRCIFVGDWGDVSTELFNDYLNQNGLYSEVIYVGKKYGKEKESYFKSADIFVLPTFYKNECLPLVLLEAMQYALPIISTPEGGIRDLVIEGKTGYLCQQQDVTSLVLKLKELIENPEKRILMGLEGRRHYKNNFTSQHFEKKIVEIIDKAYKA